MVNYIDGVNGLIRGAVSELPNAVLFGENVNNGSRISGLCKGIVAPAGGRFINVGNCEATHCGAGFGMMLNGANAVLFAKQLDFMLLGMDHFVSTYNSIRASRTEGLGSFTIVCLVCDQGFQGPQSSFNALGDLCSLARVDGYTITNTQDSTHVLHSQIGKPGFRFITLSQALFGREFLNPPLVYAAEDSSVFQYTDGDDLTIACFNFSFPTGFLLQRKLADLGIRASLFSTNYTVQPQWERIITNAARSRKLVIIDDSKSVNSRADALRCRVHDAATNVRCVSVGRADVDFAVSSDELKVDLDSLVARLNAQVVHV